MTRLSVNINKVATLRNARGGQVPDVVQVAQDCERFGAQGITVHPRPDERHIRRQDVYNLKRVLVQEFNIEGFPSPDFLQLIKDVSPAQVTLVPDSPEVLTSNQGWDTLAHQSFLRGVVAELKSLGTRVSVFVNAQGSMVEGAALAGADRVELYTEPYAAHFQNDPALAILPFIESARVAQACGLGLNAGHDLSLVNLRYFHQYIPGLLEVSIGHALISDALYFGLENTIQRYLDCLKD